MNAEEFHYIVGIIYLNSINFLLWKDGINLRDSYLISPESSFLLSKNTEKELMDKANKFGYKVAKQKPVLVNLDKLLKKVSSLHPNRSFSTKTCSILLEGWNTLEDIKFSISTTNTYSELDDPLSAIYDKLFFGKNLPSINPPDKIYSPDLSSIEIKIMSNYLRSLIDDYVNNVCT